MRREGPTTLVGSSPQLIGHHVEIRGLGIADVAALFGMLATLEESRVDLVLELEESNSHQEIERLGLEEESYRILDVDLPLIRSTFGAWYTPAGGSLSIPTERFVCDKTT